MDFNDPILPHIPTEDTFNSQLLENNTFEDEIFSLPDETGLEKLLFSVLESEGSEEMQQFAEDIRRLHLAKEETPNGFDGDVDGDEADGEEFITRYPAWQPEEVSEVWHARRWYEFGFEMLNPLWISPETGKQFFVRGVTRMKNGELVYPLVWVTLPHGSVGAFSSRVVGQDNDLVIAQEDVITDPIPAKELLAVLEQLEDENGDVYSLNPLRSTVGINDDFLVVFVSLWADDVSGNQSKQYNKHVNIDMQNTNLPAKLLNQDHFINFISTSQHASWAEQMAEILKIIQ
ncbi:hypothetical protein I311_05388 [Cryptococcus gattii NT-10]|nr:hypothetical protein I311_05388 [Cryptococcus gattii NT-10]